MNPPATLPLGFVTNCLGQTTITHAAAVAERLGFDCLEVGASVALDVAAFRAVQRNSPVKLQSLIFSRNYLHPEASLRQAFRAGLRERLALAAELGIGQITMATGVDPRLGLAENILAVLDFWGPIWEAHPDITFAMENCPMTGNFALGPATWRPLLEATAQHPNFGLNFDPSHLIWQMIDPYAPLGEFAPHLKSVHAKDTVVWREVLAEHGILTPYKLAEVTPHGMEETRAPWWGFRLPNEGDLDWARWVGELLHTGYRGVIMIEHEDPRYTATPDLVEAGLRRSLNYLRHLLASQSVQEAPS
ncbi:MAG: sugar phosphate isomerase/epimerase [Anaerolineae bacterium]|nr:sugar phosphate isomerase/epimerase [Anaerolineae bacterium]